MLCIQYNIDTQAFVWVHNQTHPRQTQYETHPPKTNPTRTNPTQRQTHPNDKPNSALPFPEKPTHHIKHDPQKPTTTTN